MSAAEFSLIVGAVSILAGFFGALSGLGGGAIIVPLLVLGMGVDMHYAIGASLMAVIASSSGASAAYVREGYSNIRIAIFLESATTVGAIFGAFLATKMPSGALLVIFGFILLYSSYISYFPLKDSTNNNGIDPWSQYFELEGTYPTPEGPLFYRAKRAFLGYLLMLGAGLMSGLLGVGSGAIKVVALDQVMRLPFKVSTTTSNFMIGVTGAASAGTYLHSGFIDPPIAMPVILGVLLGSVVGARLLPRMPTTHLRKIFAVMIFIIGIEMIVKGFTRGVI